ncbi:RidA family protein [Dyadobacter sp. CY345]|uniref:RidA family protein n=1 Tax=Dyadobacter sp. CY345 TaxID=2909335 RepID=UPI001F2D8A0E|nr:RidA family protein [Dyadobacter sp. CY345]MCF2444927.1 RidA family protein [Dyadobacter sp. CY345]
MKKTYKSFFLVPALTVFCALGSFISQAQTVTDYEARIKEKNIKLIKPVAPIANYVKAVQVGNLVYLSGHGPDKPEGGQMIGKVGAELTIEQGKEAARLTGISLISTLKGFLGGDLNKVKRIVKLLGMVNSTPEFDKHPMVINGCSDLLVEIFGENGKHARSAVGMGSLPGNIPVEIEMIVELK